jgi:hypothetical protein
MLCFVMALKSKQVSNDWSRVCQLFEASLISAFRQTDPDLRVIVVCHETPTVRGHYDHRLEFINVDSPVPAERDTSWGMKDKWSKLQVGLIRCGEIKPQFVMIMDADDLVSNRLVALTRAHPHCNGWTINLGYYYRFGSKWILRNPEFNCGTNAIVSSRLIEFPTDTSRAARDRRTVLRWGHTVIARKLAEAGTPLQPIPFPGAVYVHSHGENDSHFGQRLFPQIPRPILRRLSQQRFCSARIRREFAIDALP